MAGFTEATTVQGGIVSALQALGWTFIPGSDLPRTTDEMFIEEHLKDD